MAHWSSSQCSKSRNNPANLNLKLETRQPIKEHNIVPEKAGVKVSMNTARVSQSQPLLLLSRPTFCADKRSTRLWSFYFTISIIALLSLSTNTFFLCVTLCINLRSNVKSFSFLMQHMGPTCSFASDD